MNMLVVDLFTMPLEEDFAVVQWHVHAGIRSWMLKCACTVVLLAFVLFFAPRVKEIAGFSSLLKLFTWQYVTHIVADHQRGFRLTVFFLQAWSAAIHVLIFWWGVRCGEGFSKCKMSWKRQRRMHCRWNAMSIFVHSPQPCLLNLKIVGVRAADAMACVVVLEFYCLEKSQSYTVEAPKSNSLQKKKKLTLKVIDIWAALIHRSIKKISMSSRKMKSGPHKDPSENAWQARNRGNKAFAEHRHWR